MANALDRVKAAEAKYAAMGETAEKLESTLKNFKAPRPVLCGHARVAQGNQKDQKDQRWAFWWLVLVVGDGGLHHGFPWKFSAEGAVRALDALGAWWGS